MRANRRLVARTKAQLHRAELRKIAEQKDERTEACVNAVLLKVRDLLQSPEFIRAASEVGVRSIPAFREASPDVRSEEG